MKSIPVSLIAVSCAALTAQAQAGVSIDIKKDSAKNEQVSEILKIIDSNSLQNQVFTNSSELAKAFAKDGKILDIDVTTVLSNNYHSSDDYTLGNYSTFTGANVDRHDSTVSASGGCHCHSNCHSNCHSSRSWR